MQLLFRALKDRALQVHVAKDNSILGEATVTTTSGNTRTNISMTEHEFKTRYNNHKLSFKDRKHPHGHMTPYFQNTFGDLKDGNMVHRLRDQLAHHQKFKCILRQTISMQPMFSWKTLYLVSSKCLSLKQEIWASNEMAPRKEVLRGNQSEEASLQPFLNLKRL